jgi:MFS transporter, DHA2 family, multidrug resistance protein
MKPFIGLAGILLAAMTSEFNDQVTSIALVDVRGALGVSYDPGTWIQSLYSSAQIVGMAFSPWLLTTFTLRRWTLFAIALCGAASTLIPFCPNIESIYALRLLQGFAGGLILPLLMVTALRALRDPSVRLYGFAFYALTASFTAGLAASLAALWTDLVNWRFVFLQALPLCTVAAALVWYGDPEDQPHYERFHCADWSGALLAVIGFGALSTMLYQGDRLDWFNSPLICVLALISAVAIPLFVVNEWFHPLPLMKPQLLGRRNIAYGGIGLFVFLIIAQAGTTVPLQFLQQVQGYRPSQSALITLEIALPQLVLLPAVAFLLYFPSIDARAVSFVGLVLILTACIGLSHVDYTWNRDQFYLWQAIQAVGQPLVIMPLLMLATSAVRAPAEAPHVSALINTPRALSEVFAVWLFALISRWRGSLHSDRIIDQIGQVRFRVLQHGDAIAAVPIPPFAQASPRAPHGLQALRDAVQQQVAVMTTADTFLVLAALTIFLMIVVVLLPVRTPPPSLAPGEAIGYLKQQGT